ncbi:MAG: DinB family protein [Flavobacteriales bacterium]|nr:DinB family protein [Flavobacteriales bacterium]
MRPEKSAYGAYYQSYIQLVEGEDVLSVLRASVQHSHEFWSSLTEEQGNFRYTEGKWSIKELLQHIIDTERIFSYRALAIARGEITALPSFDENAYARNCLADSRLLSEMVLELLTLRKSTTQLFDSFSEEKLDAIGTASNNPLSARAAGFIIAGHELHHIQVVKERYLHEN